MRVVRLITCVLCLAHTARADSDEADRLFEAGRALTKEGKFAEACELFGKSIAIERTIGTELNLADCHERLGDLREAWGLFIAGAGDAEAKDDKRAEFARQRAAALEPRMATVIIKVAQPDLAGLLITISGRATQAAAEIHEHADPGTIAVIATAPHFPRVERRVTGRAGETVTIEIPSLDPDALVPRLERSPMRRHVAYGLGIAGAASFVTAAALTLIGHSHYSTAADGAHCTHVTGGVTCDDVGTTAIHDAQRLADVGTVFVIAGVALGASAALVYLTAPREQIYVRPRASTQAVGLVLGGSF